MPGGQSDRGGEQWKSRLGVILAVAGSAVGLGNFLRFPGLAVENGGGAFLIPYICAFLFLGIPIGWAEWTMGRYGGRKGMHSSPAVMGVVGRGRTARYLGVIGLFIPLVVYMYYGLIESWCLRYAFDYIVGGPDLGADPAGWVPAAQAHFAAASGSGADGSMLSDPLSATFVCVVIVFGLNLWLIHRGLSGGIEWFCTWAFPMMGLCGIVVLARVITLGTPDPAFPERSVVNGLGFMWNPDLAKLANFDTWLAAAGQVFFSLSVGFGVIINYASYLRKKDDVVLSGLTSSATDSLFAIGLGGMITIPAAFVFLGAEGTSGGTFGLGFTTLPVVFAHMGPFGRMVGALWFFMLFLAAITSSISMLQPVKAFVIEALGVTRRTALWLVGLPAAGGTLWVAWWSRDLVALDTLDFWIGTTLIFLLAGVQVFYFAWVFGIDRGFAEAHHGAQIRIPSIFKIIIKYVAPAYLIVVLVGFCVQKLPDYIDGLRGNSVAQWTIGVALVTLLYLLWATRVGEIRWRRAGLDIDGERPPEEDD